ncbi:MAG TPA: class I SAM-dependent methyltransferase [Terriglobales bacterium]|jgi:ubiquinone/menaquinone biosynthesis C-methylase UbiE|nr:class I SAM-dependent methyltransferase [Terriglobales bacterium]
MSSPELRTSSLQVEYALGHSSRELDRLTFQATVFAPYTRQLLTEAGLAPGMRVLDVGSGSGDVSFLAADLVGANGSVLGVDRSPAAVERARSRAIRRNHHNVEFAVGDPAAMHFDRPFDAIIGRFVLMYQDDPAASLRNMMRNLREGGLVAFQEVDSTACRSWPAVASFDTAARWLAEALRGSGARPELGLEMHALFLECGLPQPSMRMDTLVSGEEDSPVYDLLAEAVRTLVPTLEKLNIASAAQVQIESLADRMRQEVSAKRAVAMSYGLVGAWAKKQGGRDEAEN